MIFDYLQKLFCTNNNSRKFVRINLIFKRCLYLTNSYFINFLYVIIDIRNRSYSASAPEAPLLPASAAHPESARAEAAPIANIENGFENFILLSFGLCHGKSGPGSLPNRVVNASTRA